MRRSGIAGFRRGVSVVPSKFVLYHNRAHGRSHLQGALELTVEIAAEILKEVAGPGAAIAALFRELGAYRGITVHRQFNQYLVAGKFFKFGIVLDALQFVFAGAQVLAEQ